RQCRCPGRCSVLSKASEQVWMRGRPVLQGLSVTWDGTEQSVIDNFLRLAAALPIGAWFAAQVTGQQVVEQPEYRMEARSYVFHDVGGDGVQEPPYVGAVEVQFASIGLGSKGLGDRDPDCLPGQAGTLRPGQGGQQDPRSRLLLA